MYIAIMVACCILCLLIMVVYIVFILNVFHNRKPLHPAADHVRKILEEMAP